MNWTVIHPQACTRGRERRERTVGRARLVCSALIAATVLGGTGLADQPPPVATELGEALEELESFSEQMEAALSGDRHELRRSALGILRRFEQRLPELRRRSRDALSRLDGRIARESGRVQREQRLTAVAVEKLKGMRRSMKAEAARASTRPCSSREEQVRALTDRLVAGLLRDKERQVAKNVATLGERSRRNRALDQELAESRSRLDSLFLRLETALPRAASLLAQPPPILASSVLLDRSPRRLVLALDRIQKALLDVMAAHVVTLEAMSSEPASRGAPGRKDRDTSRPRQEKLLETRGRLRDASTLRVRLAEDEPPKRPDSLQNSENTKGRNRP